MSDVKEIPIEIVVDTPEASECEDAPETTTEETCEASQERTLETVEAELNTLKSEYREKLEAVAVEAREQYEAERERLLRTAAEAENAKRRVAAETERKLQYANEALLEGLIPVLDSLEAAIKSIAEKVNVDDTDTEFATFSEGVQLVQKQLLDALKIHGLTPIEALGETFDPGQHQAILAMPSDEIPEGKVVEEYQRGYQLHARVLRASQVVVSQGPAATEEPAPETDDNDTHET